MAGRAAYPAVHHAVCPPSSAADGRATAPFAAREAGAVGVCGACGG